MRETLVELHSGTITDSELTGGASGTQLLGQGTVLESHLAAGMLRLGASQQRPPSSAVEEKELEEASRRRLSKPDGSTWKSSATVLLLCVLVILQVCWAEQASALRPHLAAFLLLGIGYSPLSWNVWHFRLVDDQIWFTPLPTSLASQDLMSTGSIPAFESRVGIRGCRILR